MLKCKQSFPNNLNESLKASDIENVNWDNESCCVYKLLWFSIEFIEAKKMFMKHCYFLKKKKIVAAKLNKKERCQFKEK
jgi:hypothetical protein